MPGSSDVVWLILHGNGGNIGVRLDQYKAIHHRYGASIVAVDYRGYGRSVGEPSEEGFYADALAAHWLAAELHPGKRVVVFGRSMGGPVAAQLASVVDPAALVLEASISSLQAVMRERASWIRFTPFPMIIRAKFETTKYVANSSTPTLIFHGDSDQAVSIQNANVFSERRQSLSNWRLLRKVIMMDSISSIPIATTPCSVNSSPLTTRYEFCSADCVGRWRAGGRTRGRNGLPRTPES